MSNAPSGFQGTCTDDQPGFWGTVKGWFTVSGGCTGVIPDATPDGTGTSFIDIEAMTSQARSISDPARAQAVLDQCSNAMDLVSLAAASLGAADALSPVSLAGYSPQSSVDQANQSIAAAYGQIQLASTSGGAWQPFFVDAVQKTVVVLNMVGAKNLTINFAGERLAANLSFPPLPDFDWIQWIFVAIVLALGAYITFKVTR